MSKVKVKVPEVGESIEEVIIAQWLKEDGDQVEKDENICEIESDKANMEIPAPSSGILKVLAKKDETVKIGKTIAEIDESGFKKHKVEPNENIKEEDEAKDKEEKEEKGKTEPNSKDNHRPSQAFSESSNSQVADLDTIKEDPKKQKKRKITKTETRERMNSFQRSMAKRLIQAQSQTASATTYNEVDLSKLMQIRKEKKEEFKNENGVKLGIMSFFVKAVCKALREYPLLNAQIEQDDIINNSSVNMGIAISRSKGLVVPVLKGAQEMSYAQIEKNILEMSKKAESGKLSISELTGGTFSITNGGIYGSMFSTPILNPPQVAILGMHSIEHRPIAIKNETGNHSIEVRPMMYLALTYDHRLIEGKLAVQFLNFIKQELQSLSADLP